MKKLLFALGILITVAVQLRAQDKTAATPNPESQVLKYSRDFLLLQLSYDSWAGGRDSTRTHGLGRGFNVDFMYDFPLANSSHFSVSPGLGISTSGVFLKKHIARIGTPAPTLNFPADSSFKRYKVATSYVEIPIELRYRTFENNANKGFKAAIGLKFGALLNAHTKASGVQTGSKQIQKLEDKRYFSPWRVAATARVGLGNISIFSSYSLTGLLKQNAGSNLNTFSIGLCLSGM